MRGLDPRIYPELIYRKVRPCSFSLAVAMDCRVIVPPVAALARR